MPKLSRSRISVITLPVTVSSTQNTQQSKSSEYSWEFLYYKSKIILAIALQFLTNIRYSEYISMRLSVGIWWTLLGSCIFCAPLDRCIGRHIDRHYNNNNNNNNIFISCIKYTNITPPANSKANRGRWCVDGLRFITIFITIFVIKRVSHERNWDKKIEAAI